MNPGARLIVLGKQGAGKGTQALRLSRHFVVPHISTGDTFRAAVRSGSEFGQQAKSYLDAGDLVPDEVVIGVVRERLGRTDTTHRGFILDGFPRTVRQAESLAELMAPRELDLVVNLEVSTETVLGRLSGRRVCDDCGANYSVAEPPRVRGICDDCGGEVIQRADDTEAAIRRRLELYEQETAPLIDWYHRQRQLATLDATESADVVTDRIVTQVVQRRPAAQTVEPRRGR